MAHRGAVPRPCGDRAFHYDTLLIGEGELEALPTLNRLTALSDPFLERLGGAAAVDSMLEAGPFQSYPYPGEVLYQAGSAE